MAYTSNWTGGFDSQAVQLEIDDNYELKPEEQKPVVAITATAASKSVLLGLPAGETMTVINSGENTVSIANVESENGTSLASGSIAFVFSKGADGAVINTLYPQSGGGGGVGTFEVTFTAGDDAWSADKTFAELKAAITGGQNIRGLMAGERTTCLTLEGWCFAEGDTESVYFSAMALMQGESSWTLAKRDFAFSDDESVYVEENSFLLTPSE